MSTDRSKYRCPYLGTPVDTDTWFASPSEQNYCHKVKPAQPIVMQYQQDRCLSETFQQCPIYKQQGVTRASLPKGILGKPVDLPQPSQTRRTLLIIAAVVVLLLGLAAYVLISFGNPRSQSAQNPSLQPTRPPLTSTHTPSVTLTEAALSAAEPTQTASASVQSPVTNTPTVPPAMSANPGSVTFDTNLRMGPSIENDIIVLLKAGTNLSILGRDTFGVWLLVETEGHQLGWIAATQIEGDFIILELPVASDVVVEISTQPSTARPAGSTPQASAAPTGTAVGYPSRFRVNLSFTPIRDACGQDLSNYRRDYVVSIVGGYITWDGGVSYWEGSFDSKDGAFDVIGYPASGIDRTTGSITITGSTLFIEGEVLRETTKGDCDPRWTFYGQTTL